VAQRHEGLKAKGLRLAWTTLLVLGAPMTLPGADNPRWLGGQVYEENDSVLLADGDQRYTQGFRISINRNPGRPLCLKPNETACLLPPIKKALRGWLLSHDTSFDSGSLAIILGQNLYTPRIITAPVPEPKDRAFSGYLYLGTQVSFTSDQDLERHTLELDLGLFGQESLGRGAQAGLHVLRHHRIPKGWGDTEPRHGLGANVSYRFEERLPLLKLGSAQDDNERTLLDATIGTVGEAGNVRTGFGLHGAVRVGWDLTGFPAATIPMAAGPRKRRFFEVGGIAGYEIRSILNTSFVRSTEGTVGFSQEPLVWDWRIGAYVRTGSFRVTVQKAIRSPEFSIQGVPRRDQDFASIAISYEPQRVPDVDDDEPAARKPGYFWLFKHWELELGAGRNFFGPEVARGSPRGHAGHLAIRKWIAKGFSLGLFDIGGVSVETVPARPGEPFHTDLFLTRNAVSVGWKPRGPKGALAFRAGFPLWGRTAKLERVMNPPDEDGALTEEIDEREIATAKRGLLLGAQFFQPIEKHLALGVDITYQRLVLNNASVLAPSPNFVAVVIAAQIRP
jgi:hypothetical protein